MPKRIQRKRTKGWRMPEGAVYVGRPGRWGNPAAIGRWVSVGPAWKRARRATMSSFIRTPRDAVVFYRSGLRYGGMVLGVGETYCHGTVLLRIAAGEDLADFHADSPATVLADLLGEVPT